jgi:hypothetical protein
MFFPNYFDLSTAAEMPNFLEKITFLLLYERCKEAGETA